MNNKPEFIYIESSNFKDFPIGGTLSFSLQMMKAFGNRMALVGFVTDDTPVGKWVIKDFNGISYNFFGIQRIKVKEGHKPLIPARLTSYYFLKKYLKKIEEIDLNSVFTRTPQFAIALSKSNFNNKCFCFAGTTNSVAISRYAILRMFSSIYEKKLFKSLKTFNTILASSDNESILQLIKRSKGLFTIKDIYSFPTRFDDTVFVPLDKFECREKLKIEKDIIMLLVVGRLSWVKGWDFIINAFSIFIKLHPNSKLFFVGDGEDKEKLLEKIYKMNLQKHVVLTGRVKQGETVFYLNAADVFLVGSFYEGWSNAMIEALGCGKTIVTTKVSGASEMVLEGKNGFVVEDRNPEIFARKISESLNLKNSKELSLSLSKKYTLTTLDKDLEKLWLKKNLK